MKAPLANWGLERANGGSSGHRAPPGHVIAMVKNTRGAEGCKEFGPQDQDECIEMSKVEK